MARQRIPACRAVTAHPASPKSSGWIRRDKRLAIYIRDGERCVYCGSAPLEGTQGALTLDHILPRHLGGTNAPDNLLTSCRQCNCARGSADLTSFVGPDRAAKLRKQARTSLAAALFEVAVRREAARRLAEYTRSLVASGWTPPFSDDVPF